MQNSNNLDERGSDGQQLLRQEEVAKILNLSPRTLEAWRHRGGGPRYILLTPRCVRYKKSDLNQFLAERVRTSTSDRGDEAA